MLAHPSPLHAEGHFVQFVRHIRPQSGGPHPLSELAISVSTVEEQLAGWFTALRRTKQRDQLAKVYLRLALSVPFLARWPILSFTLPAIVRFEGLQALKLNVRTTDLRIAAIALENAAIVVTRNLRDFQRVPGLVVEDWTV